MTVPYATTDSVLETTLILESDVDPRDGEKCSAGRSPLGSLGDEVKYWQFTPETLMYFTEDFTSAHSDCRDDSQSRSLPF